MFVYDKQPHRSDEAVQERWLIMFVCLFLGVLGRVNSEVILRPYWLIMKTIFVK